MTPPALGQFQNEKEDKMHNEAGTLAVCEVKNPTIREQLTQRRESLVRQMGEIDAAVALLDQNPNFEAIHDAISKLNMRGLLR